MGNNKYEYNESHLFRAYVVGLWASLVICLLFNYLFDCGIIAFLFTATSFLGFMLLQLLINYHTNKNEK